VKQLTLRGFDEQLGRAITELAAREGISWNRAVLRLARRGAGLGAPRRDPDRIGDSLDAFAGTWSAAEAREFEETASGFEQIDEELWR